MIERENVHMCIMPTNITGPHISTIKMEHIYGIKVELNWTFLQVEQNLTCLQV